VEPYALINGREGWYVATFDPSRADVRHFRLDRFKSASVTDESFEPRPDVDPAADVDGWPRTGEVPASRRARVWISPERARWAREERTVVAELDDGAVIVELGLAGVDWLGREVLKEAGDGVVLEAEDARAAGGDDRGADHNSSRYRARRAVRRRAVQAIRQRYHGPRVPRGGSRAGGQAGGARVQRTADRDLGPPQARRRVLSVATRARAPVPSPRDARAEGADPVGRQRHAPATDHAHERQAARAGRQQASAVLWDRGDGRG